MKVITLCGSTKFKKQFREAEAALTYQGNIVISLGFFEQSENIKLSLEKENLFKQMHFRKIDMSNEIFVIDVDNYIGESTRNEIEYAKGKGKIVRYYSETELQPLLSDSGY